MASRPSPPAVCWRVGGWVSRGVCKQQQPEQQQPEQEEEEQQQQRRHRHQEQEREREREQHKNGEKDSQQQQDQGGGKGTFLGQDLLLPPEWENARHKPPHTRQSPRNLAAAVPPWQEQEERPREEPQSARDRQVFLTHPAKQPKPRIR